MTKKPVTLDQLDASIARWKTRLKIAVNKVSKLEQRRKRLVLKQSLATTARVSPTKEAFNVDLQAELESRKLVEREPAPVVAAREAFATPPGPVMGDSNLDIPDFLKRAQMAAAEDLIDTAADILRKEIADAKAAKARGRIAKMKAKQSGETKRMPLTGKAALAALRDD